MRHTSQMLHSHFWWALPKSSKALLGCLHGFAAPLWSARPVLPNCSARADTGVLKKEVWGSQSSITAVVLWVPQPRKPSARSPAVPGGTPLQWLLCRGLKTTFTGPKKCLYKMWEHSIHILSITLIKLQPESSIPSQCQAFGYLHVLSSETFLALYLHVQL